MAVATESVETQVRVQTGRRSRTTRLPSARGTGLPAGRRLVEIQSDGEKHSVVRVLRRQRYRRIGFLDSVERGVGERVDVGRFENPQIRDAAVAMHVERQHDVPVMPHHGVGHEPAPFDLSLEPAQPRSPVEIRLRGLGVRRIALNLHSWRRRAGLDRLLSARRRKPFTRPGG